MDKIKEPIIYLFLYREVRKKANKQGLVTHSCVLSVLRRRIFQIPSVLHLQVIRELEWWGLLKKLNKHSYKLTGGEADKIINKNFSIIE